MLGWIHSVSRAQVVSAATRAPARGGGDRLESVLREPLHMLVRRYVLDHVESGSWPVGSRIPSEHELCQQLSVSRATVVRALTDLVAQGVLERRQGKGTFVTSPRLLHGPFALKSFTEEHGERGLTASARVLACAEEVAPPQVAEHLRLPPGGRVVRVKRVRFAGPDQTMGIQTAYLPADMVPGLAERRDLLRGSLYQVLDHLYQIRPVRAVETFEPAWLTPEEAALLQCPDMRLAFQVERVSYAAGGVPVEYVRSRMRGDRYRYTMELIRRS
jgi:GntR family transcriptional regulator